MRKQFQSPGHKSKDGHVRFEEEGPHSHHHKARVSNFSRDLDEGTDEDFEPASRGDRSPSAHGNPGAEFENNPAGGAPETKTP